jgi:prophage regulatory protein
MNTASDMQSDRLIPLTEVEMMVGLKKTAIYERINKGTFPGPVKMGSASRWSFLAVQQVIRQMIAANDGVLPA